MRQFRPIFIGAIVLILLAGVFVFWTLKNANRQSADTLAQLQDALDIGLGRSDNIELTYDAGTKTAKLVQTEADEEVIGSAINIAHTLLRRFGEEAFSIEGVEILTIIEQFDNRPLVSITMNKSKFEAIDWESLMGKPVMDIVKENSSNYEVDPEVLEFAQPDELA